MHSGEYRDSHYVRYLLLRWLCFRMQRSASYLIFWRKTVSVLAAQLDLKRDYISTMDTILSSKVRNTQLLLEARHGGAYENILIMPTH